LLSASASEPDRITTSLADYFRPPTTMRRTVTAV
jgi:hypothetical protein